MRWVSIALGEQVPAIGQGTWHMGEKTSRRAAEVDALRLGIEEGLRLIDTAEIYAGGEAERIVGDAIADCRGEVFVVTKVWPSSLRSEELLAKVDRSLARLCVERVDALLIHWPVRALPITVMRSFVDAVQNRQMARYVGVSNFWLPGLKTVLDASTGAGGLTFNQMPYHLADRAIESAVLPFCQTQGIRIMAYSPLGRGRLERHPGFATLRQIAEERGVSPYSVALNWVITHPGIIAIPKASRPDHIRTNAQAASWTLSPDDIIRLESAFLPTPGSRPLRMPPYAWAFRGAEWGMRTIGRLRR